MLLLSAAVYAGYVVLDGWLMGQDRYLVAQDLVPIPDRETPVPASTLTAQGAVPARAPARASATFAAPTPTTQPKPSATPTAISSPSPTATPTTPPPAPVQIRIPAIGVKRTIIELPLKQNPKTGTWARDIDSLFRTAGKDLVGHWGGSAYPGQAGNMILVGHNFGYGYNGVFVRLGRLKAGQLVYVVDKAGQTFMYRVKTVKRLKWRLKDEKELAQHLSYLKSSGPERLTLVSCGGANVEPFPERVYVVAEPAR